MPDPTPTPGTLRAAVEALAAAWESKASRPPRGQLTESVQASFHACAVNLRAALAASPAPTDSPDERPWWRRDDWLPASPTVQHEVDRQPRPAAVTAPREDERPCTRCLHPWDVHGAPRGCLTDGGPRRGFCGCTHARPAAVTAPREDERPGAYVDPQRGHNHDVRVAPCRLDCPEYGKVQAAKAAAAAAVERATPDPDTLAALVPHYDWCVNPGDDDEWCSCWPVRLNVARALIAAGVTLNETAT